MMADEDAIEHALAQAQASLAIEGHELSPEGAALIKSCLQGEISEEEFLQKSLQLAQTELKKENLYDLKPDEKSYFLDDGSDTLSKERMEKALAALKRSIIR